MRFFGPWAWVTMRALRLGDVGKGWCLASKTTCFLTQCFVFVSVLSLSLCFLFVRVLFLTFCSLSLAFRPFPFSSLPLSSLWCVTHRISTRDMRRMSPQSFGFRSLAACCVVWDEGACTYPFLDTSLCSLEATWCHGGI